MKNVDLLRALCDFDQAVTLRASGRAWFLRCWESARFYLFTLIFSQRTELDVPYTPSRSDVVTRAVAALRSFKVFFSSTGNVEILFLVHERARNGVDPYLDMFIQATGRDRAEFAFWGDSRCEDQNGRFGNLEFQSIDAVKFVSKVASIVVAPLFGVVLVPVFFLGSAYLNWKAYKTLVLRFGEAWIAYYLYRYLLKKQGPTFLVMTVSYCNAALCAAAKDLGVIVVELQHGLISPNHIGYCDFKSSLCRPDWFGFFGRDWAPQLPWRCMTFVVGHPAWKEYIQNQVPPAECPDGFKHVLVISQRSISGSIRVFIEEALRSSDYIFEVKLHPAEYKGNQYEGMGSRVVVHRESLLNDLVSRCAFIVGGYSTLVIELAAKGLLVNVLPVAGVERLPGNVINCNLLETGDDLLPRSSGGDAPKFFEKTDFLAIKNLLQKKITLDSARSAVNES